MMLEAFDNIGVAVGDVPRAVRFYTELLGFTAGGGDAEGASVQLGDVSLYIFRTPTPGAEPGRSEDYLRNPAGIDHISFRVADIEAAGAELERRGVAFLAPVTGEPGEFRYRPFRDPDGNMLYIVQRA